MKAEIPHLRRYALLLLRDRDAADDLVQDVLERGLGRLHLWSQGTSLRAWLFTIQYNLFVSGYRRRVREAAFIGGVDLPQASTPADQEDRIALRDLERALWALPEDQRLAVLLVGMEGMSYDEASQILRIPIGTLRSRLSRGRKSLRNGLNGELGRPVPGRAT